MPTSSSAPTDSPSGFLSKFKRLSFKHGQASKGFNVDQTTTTASGLSVVPLFRTPSEEQVRTGSKPGQGYAFTVRKWTRPDLEDKDGQSIASHVRVEWRRAANKVPRKRRADADGLANGGSGGRSAPSSPLAKADAGTGSPPNLDLAAASSSSSNRLASAVRQNRLRAPTLVGEDATTDPNNLVPRSQSTLTPSQSATSLPAGGIDTNGGRTSLSDDGHAGAGGATSDVDSDPEDSERPWTCHLVYRASASKDQSPQLSSSMSPCAAVAPTRRVLLATLTPAPHHPKLVGTLSIPSTLHAVSLGDVTAGQSWGTNRGLSVDELKDVASVTALWVVVRDNLGGLRDRRRKGEGSGGFRLGGHH